MHLGVLCAFALLTAHPVCQPLANLGDTGQEVAAKSFPLEQIPYHLKRLESTNAEEQIAALKFWTENHYEAYLALYEVTEHTGIPAPEEADSKFNSDLASAVNRLTESTNPRVAKLALRTLASMGRSAQDLIPPFVGRCGTGYDCSLEYHVLTALRIHAKRRPEAVKALLNDSDGTVVYNALQVFPPGERDLMQGIVREMLASPEKLVRVVGLSFLEPASAEDALATIGSLALDPDPEVARTARFALRDTKPDVQRLMSRQPRVNQGVRTMVAEICTDNHPNAEVNKAGFDYYSIILTLLEDEEVEVRRAATAAAASHAMPLTRERWGMLFAEEDDETRSHALRGIWSSNSSAAIISLRAACADPAAMVRETAIELGHDIPGRLLMRELLQAAKAGAHNWSFLSHKLGDEVNEDFLDQCIASRDERLRELASSTLDQLEPVLRFRPRLLKMRNDPSPQVRQNVVSGLAAFKDTEAVNVMIETTRNLSGYNLQWALYSLGRTGSKAALPFLRSYLQHSDRDIKGSAEVAIEQIETGDR